MDLSAFHTFISQTLRKKNLHHTHDIDPVVEQKLLSHLSYLSADLTDTKSFTKLKELIKSSPHSTNRMYYLATFPSLYETIFRNLKSVGLTGQKNGWTRLVIEKPIGTDRDSARALNDLLAEYFVEDQVFRLDHYLGKDTLHDVLDFRLIVARWNQNYQKICRSYPGLCPRRLWHRTAWPLLRPKRRH